MLLAFKAKIALAALAGFATPLAVAPLVIGHGDVALDGQQAIVEIAPGTMDYRLPGEFTRDRRQIEAPRTELRFDRPLSIMLHQVSAADYQLCVDDSVCHPMPADTAIRADRPAVQVSWQDATTYADWLSRKTGAHYRLPTDAEWAFAAGSKFKDDGLASDSDDPSVRWIARYERESERDDLSTTLRSFGGFGSNERGLLDLSGNVWEWTATCFDRTAIDSVGRPQAQTANCGVRIAEGRHRAYVSDFIRDAKAGGCSAGLPPIHLGFRLVREPAAPLARLRDRLERMTAAAGI
ncbi:formylglycine-generating enzyme family protein [Rhodopseudomonas palustris]|uniref:Formylglycine-generating enzyme family protein n=1 Tax=Rhodopseudomonas palustris TaxID=1076 RepID=A0A323UPV1_RHOPL|nr:SUMF1/EgtB/PvdO family nonheme iron enzyme [Rhodopseudomonas palustris]PZA13146.1 formylglycine-generating enzyme family protein [Rhodopseudomonas palustris]